MLATIKEVFAFTRGETIALCVLLVITLVGGGLVIYDHSRQSLPPRMIFEAVEAETSSVTEVAGSLPEQKPQTVALPTRPLRLNINTAPAESLQLLPLIGATLSRRIVDYRTQHGPFASVDQLVAVNGIGIKNLQKLRPYLICE